MTTMRKSWLYATNLLFFLISTVSATVTVPDFTTVPCQVIRSIFEAVYAIGGTLVAMMFVLGGVKYTFAADDPGGRKSGKTMIIHAVIGGILLAVVLSFRSILAAGNPWFNSGITTCLSIP